MQWLVHHVTGAVAEALKRREDTAHELAELGIGDEPLAIDVLKAAHQKQWDIVTANSDLALACVESDFWFGRSIVYLQLSGGDVEQDDAIDRLFARYKRLTPGRLYTVTGTRVKVRQLPGSSSR